jgi:phenylalanyl-tRNA synthetase alpha chain
MSSALSKLIDELAAVVNAAEADVAAVADAKTLEAWRVKYLGKKARLSVLSREMGSVDADDRPAAGKALNEAKARVQVLFDAKKAELEKPKAAGVPAIDTTLPGRRPRAGDLHPITKVYYEVRDFFLRLGFGIWYGPEAEDDFHNFGALNFPEDHPSRDEQDTFYLDGGLLLRTHTSPVQIRAMQAQKPPLRVIVPGRCFRSDAPDATHYPVFHQVEGLYVDREVSLAELKGTLEAMGVYLFGAGTEMRFRPHFFPFTEPSAEVDFTCPRCGGAVCSICHDGWVEVLGAGMVDPAVFENVGYDPEEWVGYAFGVGIERLAMIKYGITDIRYFYENDLRFIKQFK